MTRAQKASVLLGLIHVAIVGVVGAKFVVDRATYPRVWVQTVPFDPDLPIRGRYVRLNAVVEHLEPQGPQADAADWRRAALDVRDGRLAAIAAPEGRHVIRRASCGERRCWVLAEPLAYFIPEHVRDPSLREPGEELWVEVTVPPQGAPRPIALGVKRGEALQPLELR